DLAGAVFADPKTATLGQGDVTFTVFVANKGPDTATGVILTDTLPQGATFVSATRGVTPQNGVLTFHLADLAKEPTPGVIITVHPTAAGTLHNAAAVSGGLTDPDPSNNARGADATVVAPPPPPQADLSVTQAAPPSPLFPILGDNVVYGIT